MRSNSAAARLPSPPANASHQAPVWISMTGAPTAAAAAVRPEMRRDAVGAGRKRDFGRGKRIGTRPAARVPHRGDVIDIDAEPELVGDGHSRSLFHLSPSGRGRI